MGLELFQFQEAREIFEEMNDVLNFRLSDLMFYGPQVRAAWANTGRGSDARIVGKINPNVLCSTCDTQRLVCVLQGASGRLVSAFPLEIHVLPVDRIENLDAFKFNLETCWI
jgi:hypothetical protein